MVNACDGVLLIGIAMSIGVLWMGLLGVVKWCFFCVDLSFGVGSAFGMVGLSS